MYTIKANINDTAETIGTSPSRTAAAGIAQSCSAAHQTMAWVECEPKSIRADAPGWAHGATVVMLYTNGVQF